MSATRARSPRRPRAYLKTTGIGDTAYFGAEAEFFIFDNIRFDQNEHPATTSSTPTKGAGTPGARTTTSVTVPGTRKATSRFRPPTTTRICAAKWCTSMIKCGLNIECHHHEVATGGQCEIDQRFDTLVKSADNMMLYKYIIRNVANQYGKTVTFMPKPLFGDNG